MNVQDLMKALHTAEQLKDTLRHCDTSGGRRESVAEHSWRVSLMAYWISDEFPEADMNKVIKMCLIHDLGNALPGIFPPLIKRKQMSSGKNSFFRSGLISCLHLSGKR